MLKNYLEKIRFTITLENLINEHQVNPILPTILIGLNDDVDITYSTVEGINKITFDATVYEKGKHSLTITVKEEDENSWLIGGFCIRDLKIHGLSFKYNLFESVYYPVYDTDYLEQNPTLPNKINGCLHIGNRGTWKYFFETPMYENKRYKIGLW